MKRLPFFIQPKPCQPAGFSLAELCVVLAITAFGVGMALPSWQAWWWRVRVDSTVQAWAGDLQAARLQALRRGEFLQLQRLSHCLTTPLRAGDWRCGWQLVTKSATPSAAMLSSPLAGALGVQLYPALNSLDINPQGEAVAGGLRLVVQPMAAPALARSICINITGRLRVVNGSTCT